MESNRRLLKHALEVVRHNRFIRPASTKAVKSNRFSIPTRIERSPTDILKALSNTVGRDPLAPPYGYLDDQYHIPLSSNDLKIYALSKESGVKAARLMINKYPDAFFKKDCEPFIQNLFPTKNFTEAELYYPSEELIYSLLEWGKFELAFNTYNRCKDQNIQVSESCKMILLDVFSIYNGADLPPKVSVMEKWFQAQLDEQADARNAYLVKNTWKENGPAEIIFNDLKTKTAFAYCSLIKGMTKHYNLDKAFKMYEEMRSLNLMPDLKTLNELILVIEIMKEPTKEQRLELIEKRLREMASLGIRPDLETMNNCLRVLKSLGVYQQAIPFALNLFKELTNLEIEPSLATYSHLISIFYPTRDLGEKTNLLEQIITRLEAMPDSFKWRDSQDSTFFRVAMSKCLLPCNNLDMAKRVFKLAHKHDNNKFLSDYQSHARFYDSYLQTVIKLGTPEEAIHEWMNLTPYVYSPSQRLVQKMAYFIYDYKCYEFIPDFWSNMLGIKLKQMSAISMQVIELLLATMNTFNEKNDSLIESYGMIADTMIKQFPFAVEQTLRQKNENFVPRVFTWSIKMLDNFFEICAKANKVDLMLKELKNFQANECVISGGSELKKEALEAMFNCLIANIKFDEAIDLIEMCKRQPVATNMKAMMTEYEKLLSKAQLEKLNALNVSSQAKSDI